MAMSNDLSHLLVKLPWNGFAARAPSTPPCGSRLWPAAGCFGKCKSSILGGFSQGNRGRGGIAARSGVPMVMKNTGCRSTEVSLDAPAVTLGVFEGALHLFPQDFGKDRAAHGARTWLGNVGRAVAARKHAVQRLLDPVRFQ